MSSIGSPNPFFIAGKKAYEVKRSLRFNPADITNLERTFSSAGNRRTWTFSFWYKRSGIGRNTDLFGSKYGGDGANENRIYFQDNDQLRIYDSGGISGYPIVRTAAKFRDVGAWYHFVVAVDTTQSTASNRVKIYANNVLQELDETTYGNQNQQLGWNNNLRHRVGAYGNADSLGTSNINSGYMAEVNFIDGFQYDPSYFGETNAITGQWNPKKYTGSYGTNGFYLNFSDNSGTTATTLGKDSSGNGNNFTPNNFSVSAGAGNDSLEDSPTNNFATLNPLSLTNSGGTFSNGNLDFTADSNYSTRSGTFSIKNGKWYWEITVTNYGGDQLHGIVYGTNPDGDFYPGSDANRDVFGIGWYGEASGGGVLYGAVPDGSNTGQTISAGTSALSSYTTNDVLGFASDIPNGTLAFYKNGTLLYTLTGIGSHDWVPVVNGYGTSSTSTINFGQRPFTHTQPSGFKKLCSANLSDPTIKLPNKHFGTLPYSSGSSNGTFTFTDSDAVDFFPDWTWIKCRTAGENHYVIDAVRGNQNVTNIFLKPDGNDNETGSGVNGTTVSSIQNGIKIVETSVNGSQGGGEIYFENRDYVTWNWNAGDTDGKTYTVTVVSDSGNKFRFDGYGTSAVTLDLAEGGTYIFNYPSGHPFRFSTTADGTHGGGSEYTTGVTHNSSTQVTIVVAASAPTLYYYCSSHSGMGGQVNTNSTLGSSNFDGSIQSTAKVNASAGFSIVTFTGTGSNATVGHGLGVTPQAFILKGRNFADHWRVYHQNTGTSVSDSNRKALKLNESGSYQVSTSYFNDTSPTSTTVSLGTDQSVNKNTGTFVMYCFSEVAGYSKFGSYTGNGSADGPFVFTGFRPAFILWKPATQASTDWVILDNERDTFNVADAYLLANSNNAEGNLDLMDILSNGFKLRQVSGNNESGQTIIYLAFAESPFKYARAR